MVDNESATQSVVGPFRGEYAFLSNFHPAPVEFEGILYPTVEHAYQAAKTLNREERQRIANLPTPGAAKRAGKQVQLRPDWEDVKIDVMTRLVRRKFTCYPDLAEKLLATGDLPIVEINTWKDTFWGVCEGVGQNHLGRILMAVRKELRTQEAISNSAVDPKLTSFVEVTGDLWELARHGVLVITTNGSLNNLGECVMGRGIALEAKKRFPDIAKKLGSYIQQHGNRCFNLGRYGDYRLVSFPTKHHWNQPADPELIASSARQLVEMTDKFGWSVVYMPRPGCGYGRLSWEQVKLILKPILDGRFFVCRYEKEVKRLVNGAAALADALERGDFDVDLLPKDVRHRLVKLLGERR